MILRKIIAKFFFIESSLFSCSVIEHLYVLFELMMRISGALVLPIFVGQSGLYPVEVLAWVGAVVILIPSYYHMERNFQNVSENS